MAYSSLLEFVERLEEADELMRWAGELALLEAAAIGEGTAVTYESGQRRFRRYCEDSQTASAREHVLPTREGHT